MKGGLINFSWSKYRAKREAKEKAEANEQARQEARKAAGKAKPLPELDEKTCLLIVAVENDDDVTMTDLTINSTPSTLPTSPTSIAQSTAIILHQPKIIFNQHARHQTKQYVQHIPLQHHPIILHHDVYAAMQSRYEFCLNIRDRNQRSSAIPTLLPQGLGERLPLSVVGRKCFEIV
ncbi:hypothetical protein RhiirB3_449097 [Rhizophagus irregularis]|nr:hypothetical protein RhiirB3_449097 [Rhizophagus irregularis]